MVRYLFIIVTLVSLQGSVFTGALDGQEKPDNLQGQLVTISGVGDIMIGTSFPSEKYLPPGNNPAPLLENVLPLLKGSGILVGNLEGPFIDGGELAKKCRDSTRCYAFRTPMRFASLLSEAGFDFLSLANNHIGDFGQEGRDSTASVLDLHGIMYAGPEKYPWSIGVFDSVKVGFCAFSPNKGTLSITDYERAASIISMLSDTSDIVIVSMHGGAEGADYQHVPKTEEQFYGENRGDVYKFAHMAIDNGADIVFGHGPHVTRAYEIYKERFIAYSLGNFCTYRRFNLSGPNGIAPIAKIKTDTSGKFISGMIIPVYQDEEGHVRIDEKKRIITKLNQLTGADFPEMSYILDVNGNIIFK